MAPLLWMRQAVLMIFNVLFTAIITAQTTNLLHNVFCAHQGEI